MSATKTVIIFRNNLLPTSETFIKEQLLQYKNWDPIAVGETQVCDGLTLDDINKVMLLSSRGFFEKFLYRLCRWFSLASPLTVRRLKKLNPNLIHAHFATSGTDIWPYAKALKLPLVVTLHGYDITIHPQWWQDGNDTYRMKRYPRKLAKMAIAPEVTFIAVSKALKEHAISRGIPENKIAVCYTGLNIEKFQPMPWTEKNKQIIFVGRMVEKKGPHILINAFSYVKSKIPNATLIIVGDGPLRSECELLAQQLGLPVKFTGALPSSSVAKLIQSSSVLCLPSVRASNGDDEGFGMVILEAQACGIPVVSSATGGAEEGIIHGITGFKFTAGDSQKLASYVIKILDNKQLLATMSKAARLHIEELFNIEERILDIEHIYTMVTSGTSDENTK